MNQQNESRKTKFYSGFFLPYFMILFMQLISVFQNHKNTQGFK